MDTKHTPGPWEVEEIGNDEEGKRGFVRAPHAGDDLVAEFYMKDNGPLIAAAPDLLEAAEHVLQWIDHCKTNGMRIGQQSEQILRAAIAKAKGEQS